jgi:hypothetical protein
VVFGAVDQVVPTTRVLRAASTTSLVTVIRSDIFRTRLIWESFEEPDAASGESGDGDRG